MQGEFTRGGLKWTLDLNEGIDLSIYLFGAFERDLVRSYQKLIPAGATVLDIGANIGTHTLPLAQHVGPNGHVVAIEATEYACMKLRKNLSLNPQLVTRAKLVHALLTASDDATPETAIQSSWPLVDGEATHDMTCGALKPVSDARVCRLDTLVNELGLKSVDWIKLDVDGHELTVLQGARECLEKYRPGIFMELAPYCYEQNPGSFAEMVSILTANSYVLSRLPGGKPLPLDPVLLASEEIPKNGSVNIIARVLNRS